MTTLNASVNHLNSSSSGNTTDSTWKQRSPNARIAEIEILVCITTFLLAFLTVFGTWRRWCKSLFLKGMLWTAYTASTSLIAYILGLMQDAPFKDKLFPIWGMFLLIAYTFPDSFSVYSLEDIEQPLRYYCQFIVKLGVLAYLWAWTFNFKVGSIMVFMIIYGFTGTLPKFLSRFLSLIWASSSIIGARAKLFEVYMKYEQELSDGSSIDPCTLKGYNYVVAKTGSKMLGLEDVVTLMPSGLRELQRRDDVVTLEKVWSCEGRLLMPSGDPDNQLKDICLSFALLNFLFLKCAGYALPVEAQQKAWRLMREGLLPDDDRAFRVIEVELKLLYELSYTKYPAYSHAFLTALRLVALIYTVIFCGVSSVYISTFADSLGSVQLTKVWGLNLDVLVTYILLGVLVFAEIIQVVMIASSEWVKVTCISTYVAKKSWQNNNFIEMLIKRICKPWFWKPWARMLGQYSLIDSLGYGVRETILAIAGAGYLKRKKDGQIQRKVVHLSSEVKQAVLESLRTFGSDLDKGRSSLRCNGVYEKLPVACDGEHEAQVILVWHIATTYFKHKSSGSKSGEKNHRIATDLSNYLAYLVGFAPRLLPGPHFEPQFQFRRVKEQARKEFKGCKNVQDRIGKLDELAEQENQEDQSIIVRGARLGKQLLHLGNNEGLDVWKILADFWSEMTLCAATSGEVRVHLEKLADGGEFITHLWALLYHAGIPSTVQSSRSSSGDGVASGSTSQPFTKPHDYDIPSVV